MEAESTPETSLTILNLYDPSSRYPLLLKSWNGEIKSVKIVRRYL